MNKEYITYLMELNNTAALKRLLQFEQETSTFDINACNALGQTMLHYAVQLGNHEMVSTLLQLGCCRERKDVLGKTPMQYCENELVQQVLQPKQQQEAEQAGKETRKRKLSFAQKLLKAIM